MTDSTGSFSRSSGTTLPSLPDGRNGNNRWVLETAFNRFLTKRIFPPITFLIT